MDFPARQPGPQTTTEVFAADDEGAEVAVVWRGGRVVEVIGSPDALKAAADNGALDGIMGADGEPVAGRCDYDRKDT